MEMDKLVYEEHTRFVTAKDNTSFINVIQSLCDGHGEWRFKVYVMAIRMAIQCSIKASDDGHAIGDTHHLHEGPASLETCLSEKLTVQD